MFCRRGGLAIWLATTAIAPLLWTTAARAGEAADATPAAAASEVSEIVVTATRKEQSLSKVAESVSAFTAAKLEKLDVKNFADLAKFTPGITYSNDSHDISVRGISSTAGSGTTGIYIDDAPIQVRNLGLNANNTLPTLFDLNRVEVLRGPQGTLFGAGSEGGTIRYITNQPSLTAFSGLAHSELAFTQDGSPSYEGGVALGGPLIQDKLGFRVSAWGRRDGGYVNSVNYQTLATTDSNANRVDTYALRGALTWAPTDALTITAGINYQKRDQHDQDEYWVGISGPGHYLNGTPDRMADPDRFVLPTLKVEWNAGPVKVIYDGSYYNRLERVNGYSGTLYNLSFFQHFLSSDPNVNQYGDAYPVDPQGNACSNNCGSFFPLLTATGINLPGMPNYYAQNLITNAQQNLTQEIRVQSNDPGSRLQWTAGFFFAFNRQQSKEEIRDPMLPQLTQLLWGEDMITAWGENLLENGDDYLNNTRAHDSQKALYIDATYSITEKLKLNVGLRYAWTKFVFENTNDGPQDLLGGPPSLQNGGLASGGKSEQPFTPKFSLSYQLTTDDLLYATAAKGYRIGGATPPLPPNCGSGFPTSYNSDSVWSYEIGTKDRFFDRKVQVSASAYYIDWSNIQQAFYVPICGIQFTTNAGAAVAKGFDLQSQWQVVKALSIDLSVGYTDAKFSKTALDANGDVLNENGDALDVAPWTLTVGAQYDFTVLGRDAFARVDDEFQSKRTTPIPNEDPATAFYDSGLRPDPATNLLALRLGVSLDRWDFAVFANNLLDTHPQLNLQHQDSSTALYEATTLRPRTVGMAANFKF
jgi:outer membrane receptor protein involved in Fe transport